MEPKLRLKTSIAYTIILLFCNVNSAIAVNTNPYEPLGVKLGGFVLSPQLDIVNEYDSNIYRTDSNEKSDHILKIRPSVNLSSNWSRHAIDLSARGDIQLYSDNSSENRQDYAIDLAGRLDVLRDSFATTKFYNSKNTESRGDIETIGQKDPVEYYLTGGFLGYEHKFNRFRVNASNDIKYYDYDNGKSTATGATVLNNDRDRYQNTAELRFGYVINPNFEAFARGSYSVIDYDKKFDNNGLQRSSTGWDSTAGIRLDFTGKLTGEAEIGYMSRNYDDSSLTTIDGVTGRLGLKWYATGLTTLSADVGRDIGETTVIGQSGYISTNVGINIDHELLRNVLLNANFKYTNKDYKGSGSPGFPSRDEDIYHFGFNAKYLFTRNFFVTGGYQYENRDANISIDDYYVHKVMLTIGAQM